MDQTECRQLEKGIETFPLLLLVPVERLLVPVEREIFGELQSLVVGLSNLGYRQTSRLVFKKPYRFFK